jgi:type III secretion protein U
LVLLVLYLVTAFTGVERTVDWLFEGAFAGAASGEAVQAANAMAAMGRAVAAWALPLFLIAIAGVLVGSFLANRGVVFALDPVKPQASRLNPAEGFRRIFSTRSFVMFLKAALKALILVGGLAALLWSGAEALFRLPRCGADCVGEGLVAIAGPLVGLALGLFILSALIDIPLQDWLFRRDMRMTRSEAKRESRESLGDPQVRGARRRNRIEAERSRAPLRNHTPTALVTDGEALAVALRYVAGETEAPVIVGIARGARAGRMIRASSGVRRVEDAGLAAALFAQGTVGGYAPRALLEPVARALNTGVNQ